MNLPFEKIKREVHIIKQTDSDKNYGINPNNRSIEELLKYGVINLNKPQGPTSHQVSDYVKKILNLKKCGHSGTLDPNVTGDLVIALESATRLVQNLLKSGKEYIGIMNLHKKIPQSKIYKTAKEIVGKIEQLPPIKSAVKRRLRTREIYYLEILEIDERNVLFKIGSEAGFYVRKFCTDFGELLGTKAHMAQLIRTKVGPFSDKEWYSLQDIKDAYEFYKEGDETQLRKIVKPMEDATNHLPKIWLMDSTVDPICHGADLAIPGIAKIESKIEKGNIVAILSLKNELISLGEALMTTKEILENQKGMATKTKKVFMPRKTYPSYKKE